VKVGIGTPAPEKGLHMKGVGDQEIMIESSDAGGTKWTMQSSAGSTNGRFEIVNRTSNANRFTILSGGNVGIGTTAPTERLQVVGNQLITGNLNVGGTINGNFTGTIATASNALNLGGVPAAQYVQTNDIRLTDARSPLAGSGYYIQNQNAAPQATGNFNISGMGTAGIFNAASQFNIAGQRVLSSNADNFNFSAGTFAGSTAVGEGNSFLDFRRVL
jgi:hypothetical protein